MACLSTAPALSAAPAAARPRAQRARLSVHAAASGESVAGRRQMLTATAGLLAAGPIPPPVIGDKPIPYGYAPIITE